MNKMNREILLTDPAQSVAKSIATMLETKNKDFPEVPLFDQLSLKMFHQSLIYFHVCIISQDISIDAWDD